VFASNFHTPNLLRHASLHSAIFQRSSTRVSHCQENAVDEVLEYYDTKVDTMVTTNDKLCRQYVAPLSLPIEKLARSEPVEDNQIATIPTIIHTNGNLVHICNDSCCTEDDFVYRTRSNGPP
jgi:hypothetical protein